MAIMIDEDFSSIREGLFALIKKTGRINDDKTFPRSILHDPGHAKLGDSFVNFLFSAAKTLCREKTTGLKVPDVVLSNAYRKSLLRKQVHLKGSKDALGDKLEALLLWTWVSGFMNFTEMVKVLQDNIDVKKLNHHEMEKITSAIAFQALFDVIADKMAEKKGK
ncbi:MAG: ribonuclease III family protein [Candidatus Hodarchaeales archaeon]|jgi:hypothetical protein